MDVRVAADVLQVPAEEDVLFQRLAGVQRANVPLIQRRRPDRQVGDVARERLGEVPPKRVLVLAQDEDPVPKEVPGRVCARAGVLHVAVHVDGPGAVAAAPRDADVVPGAVVSEGGLVGEVLPVDDESQEDACVHVPLAPQLELVGEDRRSVGEDGGHLRAVGVPLHAETNADGRQVR